jgi:very-short-patch-repair endonuclease
MSGKRTPLRSEVVQLAAKQHGVVTRHDLRALGMSDGIISRTAVNGLIDRLMIGIYVVPGLEDELTLLHATQTMYPRAVASRRAAAYLARLDGVHELVPDILVPDDCEPRLGLPHRSRDLCDFDISWIRGFRATNATRTLCDLGAVCPADVVERALESALRRGLTSVKRLEWRCSMMRQRGRRGPNVLGDLLAARATAEPTESDLETLYLQCLREHGVPEPSRQHAVWHEGRLLGRLDMAYVPERVFVELDGWAFHSSRQAFQRDRARQNDMVAIGWTPLRFTWDDVNDQPRQTAERTLSVLTWSSSCSPYDAVPR